MIYHILPPETWKTAQSNHGYTPQAFPVNGFIHCSDLYQVEKTANTIFHEAFDLLVLEIDPQRTGIRLVYENLEGGQMTFPHLYGSPLPLESVISVFPLQRDEKGDWRLPTHMQRPKPTLITEIPYGQAGCVYRSVMPGSSLFDPHDEVFDLYLQVGIQTVVVLNTFEDIATFASQDLLARYEQAGIEVLHAPVKDFSAPPFGAWDAALKKTEAYIRASRKIAIHCHAGIGRTGMFCACLAQDLLDLSPKESIQWIRQFIPSAVESEYQIQFVETYGFKL
jgi:uncharacterized protein (DUF952 family)/protein-tyrosine phosphatase